jgi:DnaJ-like protein
MLNRRTLKQINERPKQVNRLPFLAIGAGSLALAALLYVLSGSRVLALVALFVGALGLLVAYRAQKARSIVSLTYDDLGGDLAVRFAAVREACKDLASSEKIWRLSDSPEQRTLKAGDISFPPEREPARVGLQEPPGIRANIPIWGIDAGEREKIFFFPDGVLIYRGERYEGLSYKSFKVDFSPARFFEEEAIPEDAEVVGRTWRYTREDGSPDRRYTPNPQIPVILYGLLRITGPSGLDVRLQVSNRVAAARFARAFGARRRERAREEQSRRATSESGGQEGARPSAEEAEARSPARRVLGVAEDAPMAEITTAYRKLALTFHPDKVAQLKPEVREYADQKMKEINAAYAELKRQNELRPTVSSGEAANGEEV